MIKRNAILNSVLFLLAFSRSGLSQNLEPLTLNPLIEQPNVYEVDGVINGNNGDLTEDHKRIVFKGIDQVNYCLRVSDSTTIPSLVIRKAFESAALQWRKFIKMSNFISVAGEKIFADINEAEQFELNLPELKIPGLNFKYKNSCQESNIHLEIYLGMDSPETKAHRNLFKQPPIAFVLASKTTPNKAALWIGDNKFYRLFFAANNDFGINAQWTGEKLTAVFIHEIGHIIGLPHEALDVMASDYPVKAYQSNSSFIAPDFVQMLESQYFQFDSYCSTEFDIDQKSLDNLFPDLTDGMTTPDRICLIRDNPTRPSVFRISFQAIDHENGSNTTYLETASMLYRQIDKISIGIDKEFGAASLGYGPSAIKGTRIISSLWRQLISEGGESLVTLSRTNYGKSIHLKFTNGTFNSEKTRHMELHLRNIKNDR